MDAIIRRTTVETFGPVRSVTPTQVFELGFEGIAPKASGTAAGSRCGFQDAALASRQAGRRGRHARRCAAMLPAGQGERTAG